METWGMKVELISVLLTMRCPSTGSTRKVSSPSPRTAYRTEPKSASASTSTARTVSSSVMGKTDSGTSMAYSWQTTEISHLIVHPKKFAYGNEGPFWGVLRGGGRVSDSERDGQY